MSAKSVIPSSIIIQKLSPGETIENFCTKEEIDLYGSFGHDILKPITIINCVIENLKAAAISFESEVRFVNTYFTNCDLRFSYFKKGLLFDSCTFQSKLSFEAGGHNERKIEIKNCKFFGLIDFVDTWFQDELHVMNSSQALHS